MNQLRKHMPQGYLKLVNEALSRPASFSTIKNAVADPGRNKAVTEAAAFVAMENILGKMLKMPNCEENFLKR